MKSINILSVATLILLSISSYSQNRIFFCNDYTDDAEPINAVSEWSITPTGALVKILYHNGRQNISSSILNLLIDRKDDNKKYQHYYSTWSMPDQTKHWSVFEYRFTEAGEYRVKVEDANNNDLAAENIKINMKEIDNSSASLDKNIDTGTSLLSDYKNAKILLCENLDTIKGIPISPTNEFKTVYDESIKNDRNNNSSAIRLNEWVLVKNENTFNTNEITMKVYTGSYYNTFVETSKINVNPAKSWFCLKYKFTGPGDYKFELFNHSIIHIATGYIKIIAEKSRNKAYQ